MGNYTSQMDNNTSQMDNNASQMDNNASQMNNNASQMNNNTSQMDNNTSQMDKAEQIFRAVPEDIQIKLVEEYIKPALHTDELLQEYRTKLMSEKCQRLDWTVLQDIVGKIIEHKPALSQMCEINPRFQEMYKQHFVDGINTFTHPDFDGKPLASMCVCLTMYEWH
jgi:uncharacterized phage infection (PIP) family protein YhgE